MAKYKDAIEWMAEYGELDEWLVDALDPIPPLICLVCAVFQKTLKDVMKDLTKEIWEQDNVNRGNG